MSKVDKIAALAVPPLLYSYKEARAMMGGVSESTWTLWVAQGLITPVCIGPRKRFVKYEDLVRLAQGATFQKAV
jgi:hypothetical protein